MRIRNFYRVKQRIKKFWRKFFPPEKQDTKPKKKKVSKQKTPRYVEPKKCFVSHKTMFTRAQAEKSRDKLLKKGTAQYLRIYRCQFCGHWHLTHHKNLMK